MSKEATIYRDKAVSPTTSEYARAVVKSAVTAPGEPAADLDMVVRFTFDRATYYVAEWEGDQSSTGTGDKLVRSRTARLLMTDANLPTNGSHVLYVRLTDNPEAPIVNAGTVIVK